MLLCVTRVTSILHGCLAEDVLGIVRELHECICHCSSPSSSEEVLESQCVTKS